MKTNKKQGVELKRLILRSVHDHYAAVHRPRSAFAPGDRINYAGRVFDHREVSAAVEAALDFWLTSGRFVSAFERGLSDYLSVRHCSLVNSGSSANLLAFMALTSPRLGARRIVRGDEVITVAAGFPTTVAPIVQFGAVPVFVDIALPSYNIDCRLLERARSRRTKAVILAHTLGNPFDLGRVRRFCDRHGLWLVEDNCDSLGSRFRLGDAWRLTGTVGDIGTSSFYPPHHMTMGEGGAVYTDDPLLKQIIDSLRDWGRDCWCQSGRDDTCGKRFQQQHGRLPFGYDHKYVYSHFGYNLKATEMQAAIGCAQLQKLPSFIAARRRNWQMLREGLDDVRDLLVLPEPTPGSDPSWFGFLITVRQDAGFTRDQIVRHLEQRNIQTRMLFAGNLTRQPCFDGLRAYRTVAAGSPAPACGRGDLPVTDRIMRDTFWVGVYPGITRRMIRYMIDTIHGFCRR